MMDTSLNSSQNKTATGKLPITAVVAVRNEALNIARCVRSLSAMSRVVVVDSGSTDNTAEIASQVGAEVLQFSYRGGYPKKRQWALDTLVIDTPWLLLLDADEVMPEKLLAEVKAALTRNDGMDAYLICKGFHFLGRRMRFGGFSHSAVLLFRTGKARFEHLIEESSTALDMEIHERLIVDGRVGKLSTPLIHDDFKGLQAYLERHNHYSTWEARVRFQTLYGAGPAGKCQSSIKPSLFGDVQERRRFLKLVAMRVPGEPLLWFLYHYVIRLGFLEGRRGFIASQIRAQYIANVRAKIWEMRFGRPEIRT